jgi:hypothetical protein
MEVPFLLGPLLDWVMFEKGYTWRFNKALEFQKAKPMQKKDY